MAGRQSCRGEKAWGGEPMGKKSFRRFLDEWHRGSINAEGVSLGAADTYELYSYMWDVLNSRRGGFWRKRMPPQTHMEMAADWADANPQSRYRKNQLFHPETIRKLGFVVDEDGYVHLTDGVARTNTTRPAAEPRAAPQTNRTGGDTPNNKIRRSQFLPSLR